MNDSVPKPAAVRRDLRKRRVIGLAPACDRSNREYRIFVP